MKIYTNLTVNLTTIIFFLCTWGYFFINVAVAWLPNIEFLLLLVRDSWIFLLVIYLFIEKKFISLGLYFLILSFGLAALIERHDVAAFTTAYYGVRDISLYFLVGELLVSSDNLKLSNVSNYRFVSFILYLAMADILMMVFLNTSMSESVFNTSSYFFNKGVTSNLSSGFFGDRLSIPLYSSGLVCTLISIFYLFEKKTRSSKLDSFLGLVVSVFTLSKVLVVVIGFRVLGKRWKTFFVLGLFLIIPILFWLENFRQTAEVGLISYHLSSMFHHLKAFFFVFELGVLDFYPSILGSHSVFGSSLLGIDLYAIESSLLTRVLDLKIYSIFFIFYLTYTFNRLDNEIKSKFFFLFLLLMSLTATSNHPICYLPFIYLLNYLPKTQK